MQLLLPTTPNDTSQATDATIDQLAITWPDNASPDAIIQCLDDISANVDTIKGSDQPPAFTGWQPFSAFPRPRGLSGIPALTHG